MKLNIGIVALLAVCIAAVLVYRQCKQDARRINRRLDQLVTVLEKEAAQSQIRTIAKARQVTSFFTADAVIRLHPVYPHTISRAELNPIFLRVHNMVDSLSIRIRDRRFELDREGGTAIMRLAAIGTVHIQGRRDTPTYEFELHWVKQDREWFIERAEIVQGIRPPRQP